MNVLEIAAIGVVAALVLTATFLADNDRRRTRITVERRGALRPWRWTIRDLDTGQRLRCGTAHTRITAWLTAYTTVVDHEPHMPAELVEHTTDVDELAALRTERSRRAHPSNGRTPA